MEMLGSLLFLAGVVLSFIATLWFLVEAFRESVLWGLACLFLPIVQLFFLIVHWPAAKRPFIWQLIAVAMIIGSFVISERAPQERFF